MIFFHLILYLIPALGLLHLFGPTDSSLLAVYFGCFFNADSKPWLHYNFIKASHALLQDNQNKLKTILQEYKTQKEATSNKAHFNDSTSDADVPI